MVRTALPDLSRVQRIRKRALMALVLVLVASLPFAASIQGPEGGFHEAVEMVGFVLILVCVLGRTWATIYIGGRKKHTIVADGPYSLTRNPLYVFSLLGATGVGLTTGSVAYGLVCGFVAFLVFDSVIRREEHFLRATFGSAFADYMARVPRWCPRFSGWRDIQETVVRPRLILVTFRDASLFLLAVPISEVIDHLQAAGYLPVLLRLP